MMRGGKKITETLKNGEKENIEILNYEGEKWRIMGPITSFSKERLASQPCLASNELSEASLHCLLH